jgi:hypothetical protein
MLDILGSEVIPLEALNALFVGLKATVFCFFIRNLEAIVALSSSLEDGL